MISYRVVDGLPLLATVGLAEDDIFRQAVSTARKYDQIGLFLTAIVLFAIAIGALRQRKLAAATDALERSKRSLEQTNLLFDTALRNMAHGLCMFDRDQRLVVCNERYGEMYGLPPELTRPGTALRAILEARVAQGYCPRDAEHYVEERLEAVAKSRPYYAVNELRDGRIYAVSHQPMQAGGWVAIHQDITAQKQAETRIAYLARHDVLTDLSNRAVLRERMEEGLARLRRGGKAITLFMLDLDLFKGVNDSLGHPVGDELLKAVARRLLACLRETDTVARLGGDEFAVMASGGRGSTGRGDRDRRPAARGAVSPLFVRRPSARHLDQHRDRARSGARHRRRSAHQERRPRPLQGQGRRPQHLPPVRGRDGGRRGRAPNARDRPAQCARRATSSSCTTIPSSTCGPTRSPTWRR